MKKLLLTILILFSFSSTVWAVQLPTVRLTINKSMIGSGTILSGKEGLIISCAHIFPRQEYNLKSIQVELFDKTNGKITLLKKLRGEALFVLHPEDLSLIRINPKGLRPGKVVIAKTNHVFQFNERLYSWGCSDGAMPTGFWCNYRKRINRNQIETNRHAAQGRSGGGLFTRKGVMVGVLVTHGFPHEQVTQYIASNRINVLLSRHYKKPLAKLPTMYAFVRDR